MYIYIYIYIYTFTCACASVDLNIEHSQTTFAISKLCLELRSASKAFLQANNGLKSAAKDKELVKGDA